MKRCFFLILLLFGLLQNIEADGLPFEKLIEKLNNARCLNGKATYEVILPSQADPVEYTIELSIGDVSDAYCPCSYLIDWRLPRGSRVSQGFNAYDGKGNHYRYRDTRLQEYHAEQDSIPFTSDGGGVARTAQFTELLPSFVSSRINDLINDSTVNHFYNVATATLSGVQQVNGYDAFEFSYHFNTETGMPKSFDFTYNPGGISEQTVTANFDWDEISRECNNFSEEFLIEKYKDIFEKFRTSNFRVDNLKGTPMFSFTYRNSENSPRLYHNRGESDLTSLTVLIFIDSEVSNTPNFVEAVEQAVSFAGKPILTIYAIRNTTTETLEKKLEGLNRVDNVDRLIRSCGINAYPTLLIINSDGIIVDAIVGNLQDDSSLIQTLMLY